jgi:hypothetical protein
MVKTIIVIEPREEKHHPWLYKKTQPLSTIKLMA